MNNTVKSLTADEMLQEVKDTLEAIESEVYDDVSYALLSMADQIRENLGKEESKKIETEADPRIDLLNWIKGT